MKAYQQLLLQKAKDWLESVDDDTFLLEHQELVSKGGLNLNDFKKFLTDDATTGGISYLRLGYSAHFDYNEWLFSMTSTLSHPSANDETYSLAA